ncbi:hypothetical protein VOLCADRAFT_100411 [Volvox carteri f. nagariensis]|uniref:SURF1-like protein n=1 Tax=Volvox carteri f. nagariensis TaxID=3068 RepID=D8UK53_VOLCA|nr:uncharacterized protein VOLCADRAFT_100411 [Volvox carteri f. nagariensis]EFJ39905.1 hypothetical protein VOLCADRAFT_100411 [Volvox carteri f. nagariensis]|eukprot:XP_002959044.1 hypothetical protein VOLCADRAFT_100411 [Volvox carteri f. nagariensis]
MGSAGRAGTAGSSGDSAWSPFSAVMFIPSVVCGCLAYWQYERMKWKEELIRLRAGISDAEARDIFADRDRDQQQPLKEYDKVLVRGRFLHEYSLYVGPRPRRFAILNPDFSLVCSVPESGIQAGYLVVTPMVSADRKGVVLVNRGWVPKTWKEEAEAKAAAKLRASTEEAERKAPAPAATPPTATHSPTAAAGRSWWRSWFGGGRGKSTAQSEPQPAQPQPPKVVPEPEVVVGVIQYDEQPSSFMPANRAEVEEFHFIQRETMARALGLPPDTPLVMAVSTDPAASQAVQKRSPLAEARSAAAAAAAAAGPAAGSDAPTSPSAAPDYPLPKYVSDLLRFSTMPGDHRNYALIWGTLCVVLAAMARTAVIKPLRGPRIVDGPGGSARDAWKASQAN